jgi:hypothetical protein
MTDLRAAVEGLRKGGIWTRRDYRSVRSEAIDDVLRLIPEGAVLVTEDGLRDALHILHEAVTDHSGWEYHEGTKPDGWRGCEALAAAILAHLRDTPS